MNRSRVAIVGAGAAGLASAWLLSETHDVVVFEAESRIGGHVHTETVEVDGRPHRVELGTEFFDDGEYTGLVALVDRLGVQGRTYPMRLSVTTGRHTFMVPPRTPLEVLSCAPPRIAYRLYWLRTLTIAAEAVVDAGDWSLTVRELAVKAGLPERVTADFILPLVGASWGTSAELAGEMSAYSVSRVMGLRMTHQPRSTFLVGGLKTYLQRLVDDAPDVVLRLGTPVQSIGLDAQRLQVGFDDRTEAFDHVVLACNWRTSAALCAAESRLDPWRRAFDAFEDYPTHIVVHRDLSRMPRRRSMWGNVNFFFGSKPPGSTAWSGFQSGTDVFRTWLHNDEPPPPSTLLQAEYRHVLMVPAQQRRQQRLTELQGTAGLWAAGMYTSGADNHESALRSALHVGQQLAPDAERVRWFGRHVNSQGPPPVATNGSRPPAREIRQVP